MNITLQQLEQVNRELSIDNMILTVERSYQKRVINKLVRRIKDLEGRTSRLFNEEQIAMIHELYNYYKYSQRQIAELFNTSHQRISDVITGVVVRGYDYE